MLIRCLIIVIYIQFLLLFKCRIIQSQELKANKESCIEDAVPHYLQVCHYNDLTNHSRLVRFSVNPLLADTFDSYRFILRSIDHESFSTEIIKILTNFTELVDLNNSLRLFNLESGHYEVCIEFQSNNTRTLIYQPRDGCIPILVGKSLNDSFNGSSTPLLVALVIGIVAFFVLGLVVQRIQTKRRKQEHENANKSRSRSTSIVSLTNLRQQRHHLARHLFHHHIDQHHASHIRHWARIRAFRHRIAPHEDEYQRPTLLRRWSKHLFPPPTDQSTQRRSSTEFTPNAASEPTVTTNNVYTISERKHHQMPPRKSSFHLSPPEEYEMT